MALDFTYPIETSPDGYPAKFLGRDNTNTWNVVTYYIEANDDSVNTGWEEIEVNDEGITRADVEGMVPSPTPFIIQSEEATTFTLALYEDSSIIANFEDPEAVPFNEIGRISMSYTTVAGEVTAATVLEILPPRE